MRSAATCAACSSECSSRCAYTDSRTFGSSPRRAAATCSGTSALGRGGAWVWRRVCVLRQAGGGCLVRERRPAGLGGVPRGERRPGVRARQPGKRGRKRLRGREERGGGKN